MTTEVPDMQPWDQPGAFNPNPPEAPKVPRQKRKPREAAAPKERKPRAAAPAESAPTPKKPRKAREPKVERAAPETIKVTMKEYAAMKVGEDAKAFIKMHGLLSALGKASRAKVLTELQKVFG